MSTVEIGIPNVTNISKRQDIFHYLRSGFPVLWVQTYEESRAEREIIEAAKEDERHHVFVWSVTQGMLCAAAAGDEKERQKLSDPTLTDPVKMLTALMPLPNPRATKIPEDSVVILRDFHWFLQAADVVRKLRDIVGFYKATRRTLILVAPITLIPSEMDKEITLVEYPLPTKEELGVILDQIVKTVGKEKAGVTDRGRLLEAGLGLSTFEAENVFALALVKHGTLNDDSVVTVQEEKAQIVKKDGILEFFKADVSMNEVGGLNELKRYIARRADVWTDEGRAYGIPNPRGILLVGHRGCGKSLAAKAISKALRRPLLRWDIGKTFTGVIGETERNARRVYSVADATAPNVFWIDECDKGFAGLASSDKTEGGITKKVFGSYLTWREESKADVLVIATANDISALPAEFLSRFDIIFFVDQPNELERVDIFEIQLRLVGRDPRKFNLEGFARESNGFNGREIRNVVADALVTAFSEGTPGNRKELTSDHMLTAIKGVTPLSESAKDQFESLRDLALKSKWTPATSVTSADARHEGRKLRAQRDPVR